MATFVGTRDDLFSIAERALGASDAETSTRALVALAPQVVAEGPVDAYLALLDRALDGDLEPGLDDRARVELLVARGEARRRKGCIEEAAADQRVALDLARALDDRALEAHLACELGITTYLHGDLDEALDLLREALDLQTSAGAVTLTKLAMVHRERGELADARAAARRALPLHRAANDAVHVAATLVELALCDLESGASRAAREGLASALETCQPTGDRTTETFIHGMLAVITLGDSALVPLEHADLERAHEALARAREVYAETGDFRHHALFSGWLSACARARGDRSLAESALIDARRAVPETDPVRTAVELAAALFDETFPLPERVVQHAARSWDVRYVRARVETRRALRPARVPAGVSLRPSIVIEERGAWIDRTDARRVRCDNRLATQRILGTLARARIETPGRGLSAAELVDAGWPGERILPSAAKNRLRVAVAWLRKHALGEALVSIGDGYALDPRLVEIAPGEPAIDGPEEASTQRSDVRALHTARSSGSSLDDADGRPMGETLPVHVRQRG